LPAAFFSVAAPRLLALGAAGRSPPSATNLYFLRDKATRVTEHVPAARHYTARALCQHAVSFHFTVHTPSAPVAYHRSPRLLYMRCGQTRQAGGVA